MISSRADKIRALEKAIKAHRDQIDAFTLESGCGRRRVNAAMIVMFEGHRLAEQLLDEVVRANMEVVMAIEELYDSSERTAH